MTNSEVTDGQMTAGPEKKKSKAWIWWIVGGVFALFALCIVSAVAMGVWVARSAKDGVDEMKKVEAQFENSGPTDANECMKTAVEMSKACTMVAMSCTMKATRYADLCLGNAPVIPEELCEGAPDPLDMMKIAGWQRKRCADYGVDHNKPAFMACGQVVAVLSGHCQRRARDKVVGEEAIGEEAGGEVGFDEERPR